MGATHQALLMHAIAAGTVALEDLVLLLNCNGPHNSTTFTDSSPVGSAITRVGTPVISTAQSKFGGASAGILSAGGLLVPDGTHFNLTTGDFTMGCWVRRTGGAVNDAYFTKAVGTGAYPWQLWYDNSTQKFGFRGFDSTISLAYNLQSSTTVAANTWYFLVGEREGNTFRLRLNGAVEASSSFSGSLMSTTADVSIGSLSTGTGSASAYLDDAFIVKGTAVGAALGTPAGQLVAA